MPELKRKTNSQPNFLHRMEYPELYPVIENKDGSYSTHKMMSSADDFGEYAYPAIQYMDGQMFDFSLRPETAHKYARKRGEYKRFSDPLEARKFSEGSWKKDSLMNKPY